MGHAMQALNRVAAGPAGGERFTLFHPPQGAVRGVVVGVHPFAEEMNKSRRMMALGARAMARAGYAVLQFDLHGCGDSSGDLSDATWQGWIDDVHEAAAWLLDRHQAPLWLWGTRAGCLLAADAARAGSLAANLLFWQPQLQGRQALQQFLRLRMANELQRGTGGKGATDALQKALRGGENVDVAGYCLGAGVALGLGQSSLEPVPGDARIATAECRLVWLEVTTREPAQLLPASGAVLEAWRAQGHSTKARAVAGPPFWQTLEIEDAPLLVDATVDALRMPAAATA